MLLFCRHPRDRFMTCYDKLDEEERALIAPAPGVPSGDKLRGSARSVLSYYAINPYLAAMKS